ARAPAQPLRRGAGAVAARQGRCARRRPRPRAAHPRRGPARGHRPALAVAARKQRQAARRPRHPRPRAERGRARRRARPARQPARGAVPQAVVIDSHTHLDSCAPPNAELAAAATAAGVTRILTVGMDEASNRSALAASETFPQCDAAVGRQPSHAEGFDAATLSAIEDLATHAGCAAIGETGLDYYRDTAPR